MCLFKEAGMASTLDGFNVVCEMLLMYYDVRLFMKEMHSLCYVKKNLKLVRKIKMILIYIY